MDFEFPNRQDTEVGDQLAKSSLLGHERSLKSPSASNKNKQKPDEPVFGIQL